MGRTTQRRMHEKLPTSPAALTHLSRCRKWVPSDSGTNLLMEPPSLVTMPSSPCTTVLVVVYVITRLANASALMVTLDTNARSAVCSDIKLSSFILGNKFNLSIIYIQK